jgi:hypothetical protein
MDLMKFVAGGAALGIIAACWDKIKAILWRFASLFIQRVEIPSESAHQAIISYLIAHYRRSRYYDRMYSGCYEFQRDGRYGLIPYEQFGNRSIVFWKGIWPFVYTNPQENQGSGRGNRDENRHDPSTKVYSTITFIRGTLDVEKVIREACDRRNRQTWAVSNQEEEKKNRFAIHHVPEREEKDDYDYGSDSNGVPWFQQAMYRLIAHKPDELGKASMLRGNALKNLIFPEKVKNLIKEIELWRASRPWYLDRAIPWKRGWLLYGPPGTGKTALARAFAEDLNMPIYVYNLAELSNHQLMRAWAEMQVNVPCIALIEDIDNVFHGRENVARRNHVMPFLFGDKKDKDDDGNNHRPFTPLTFDCLLNCLDGVERADGIFTIITTNDIAKVDPALGQPRRLPDGTVEFISTRPGRIDKAVELTYMEAEDKKLMAKRILGDYPDEYLGMLEFIDRFPDLEETPAQFQERCAQVALACYWRELEEEAASAATLEPANRNGRPASKVLS